MGEQRGFGGCSRIGGPVLEAVARGVWFDNEGNDAAEAVIRKCDRAHFAEAAPADTHSSTVGPVAESTVEVLERPLHHGQGDLVSPGDRDVTGPSCELEESVVDSSLSPTVAQPSGRRS